MVAGRSAAIEHQVEKMLEGLANFTLGSGQELLVRWYGDGDAHLILFDGRRYRRLESHGSEQIFGPALGLARELFGGEARAFFHGARRTLGASLDASRWRR